MRSPSRPGSYEYKAALNDSFTENYGLHAQKDGPNIPLNLAPGTSVKFYYDHKSHWITDNRNSVIAVAPGSFQSELGVRTTGSPTVSAPGSRTPMAMAPTRSRRPRCRGRLPEQGRHR